MTGTIWRPTLLPIDPSTVPDVGPARMRVTSAYGNRPNPLDGGKTTVFHDGLDIGNARQGDVVTADADGRVEAAGTLGWPWSQPTTLYPTGNYGGFMVIIDHDTWVSVYAHLMPELQVSAGERVKLGQVIASVGATGAASVGGAHLHYGHLTASVAAIKALGAARKPTRDPWTVIDPIRPKPFSLSYEQRTRAQVLQLRAAKPLAAARWVARARMTQEDDGRILTAAMRLTAELTMLKEAPNEDT